MDRHAQRLHLVRMSDAELLAELVESMRAEDAACTRAGEARVFACRSGREHLVREARKALYAQEQPCPTAS